MLLQQLHRQLPLLLQQLAEMCHSLHPAGDDRTDSKRS
jgi:hypothetical protein